MALEGLAFPTWIGWLFGILLLNHPWGSPSFTSWLSFSPLYSLFSLGMYCLVMADVYTNNSAGLFLNDSQVFGKWVRALTATTWISTTFFKRLCFMLNAKRIGQVLKILSDYRAKKDMEGGTGADKTSLLMQFCRSWECIIIHFAFLINLITTFLRGADFLRNNAGRPSWFNGIGIWGYAFVYYVFAICPLVFVTFCAFTFIFVVSLRVTEVFCDFCKDVRLHLPKLIYGDRDGYDYGHDHLEIFDILKKSSSKFMVTHPMSISPASETFSKSSLKLTRLDVVNQFEEIKGLMKLTCEALSSLLLWLVVGATLSLVTTASQMFVSNGSGINFISDVLFILLLLVYSNLLQTGHKIGEMQKKAKLALHREFLNMPWTPGKLEMEDVLQEILSFEWKLSASGFFSLDRRLASGIFSLVLNYVVIFVQLNIALTEPAPATCLKNLTSH